MEFTLLKNPDWRKWLRGNRDTLLDINSKQIPVLNLKLNINRNNQKTNNPQNEAKLTYNKKQIIEAD
jgi:hypothetical protein